MTSLSNLRTKVFISYSHQDTEYLEKLKIHLKPDVREGNIDAWDDTRIRPGEKWYEEIKQALKATKIVVLLVSADFLASDFISSDELPPLLAAAQSEAVTILPVLIKPCRYKKRLGEFQFVNKPMKALTEMSGAERDKLWIRVAEEIIRLVGQTPTTIPPLSAVIVQSANADQHNFPQPRQDNRSNFILGQVASGKGHYDQAIAYFDACHFDNPIDQAKVKAELGLAYRRRGVALQQDADYTRGLQYLKEAIDLNPNDANTLSIIGGYYRRQHDYTQALDFYHQAWKVDFRSSYALGNIASLSWYLGKYSDARIFFGFAGAVATERIRQGQSEDYWDYFDLALAQLVANTFNDAKNTYVKAIKMTPGNVQLDAVLDNLYLLRRALQPIPHISEIITMIENAKS